MLARHVCLLSILLALAVCPCLTRGDDWPEFRGPTGQGLASGPLPTVWGSDQHVAWSVDIPGKGWSSPVIARGKIYLTTAVQTVGKDQSLRCLCLDAQTGKMLWNKEVFLVPAADTQAVHTKNGHASPTPIVSGDHIYVHFGHYGTACLDAQGQILWMNQEHHYQPVHGNGGSPCLVDDLLIFSCDGLDQQKVVGLDITTGKTRWQTPRNAKPTKPFSFGTPLLITVDGQKQVISLASEVAMALDPASGKEIWQVRTNGYSQVPRPVFAHGLVFVCSGFDAPELLAIRPNGHGVVTDSHIVWKCTRNVPNTSSPIVVGDGLYMISDNGVFTQLDARTGKVHWQERLPGNFSASPVSASNLLYFLNEKGTCFVVQTGSSFKLVAKNVLSGQTLASPAAAEGRLYLRTDKALICVK